MVDLKRQAIEVFLRTLDAIDVKTVLGRKIHLEDNLLTAGDVVVDLAKYKEIVVLGLGKASLRMAGALAELLDKRITRGLIVTGSQLRMALPPGLEVIVGGHPLPSQGSLEGGQRLIEVAESCGPRSLIIYLISGGGSALAESPIFPNVKLQDLEDLNRILIGCGATIEEINVIRKSISRIKAGGLGRAAASTGADSIAIYISDVNSGDLLSVASNPVLPEPPVRHRALQIVERHGLSSRLPSSVQSVLNDVQSTEDWMDHPHSVLETVLLCDNGLAIEAAAAAARNLGFITHILGDLVEGEYTAVALDMLERLADLKRRVPGQRLCLISGGEVSCVVSGNGAGGRNQQFVLYSATKLAEQCIGTGPIAVLSCGTDGIDGNSPAAGAVSDRRCVEQARRIGLDPDLYLRENDSFSFFSKMGGLILTGPTGTNVRDIRLLLSAPSG